MYFGIYRSWRKNLSIGIKSLVRIDGVSDEIDRKRLGKREMVLEEERRRRSKVGKREVCSYLAISGILSCIRKVIEIIIGIWLISNCF